MASASNTNLERDHAKNADQSEWHAYLNGNATADSGLADETISGAMDDFEGGTLSEAAEYEVNDMARDNASSGILTEINRRIAYLDDAYPFRLDGNTLYYIGDRHSLAHLSYIFCLATAMAPTITTKPYTLLPRNFELLCSDLVRFHYGHYARSIHVGWPRSHDGLPRKFETLVNDVIMPQTGEWLWKPRSDADLTTAVKLKDGGVDYIVWVESPDKQKGKFFLVGQCACGDDWDGKFMDIEPDFVTLKTWFSEDPAVVPPTRSFNVPFCLVEAERPSIARKAGIYYDRIRLTKLASDMETVSSMQLARNMCRGINIVAS